MADTEKVILSVVETTASRLPSLSIKNGQLIFIKDSQKIALDIDSKRTFYNQIVVLQTESERTSLLAPVTGLFYFVIETAILWTYQTEGWIQVTTPPKKYINFGVSNPEIGESDVLYVDKTDKTISYWDDNQNNYVTLSQNVIEITDDEINQLFEMEA